MNAHSATYTKCRLLEVHHLTLIPHFGIPSYHCCAVFCLTWFYANIYIHAIMEINGCNSLRPHFCYSGDDIYFPAGLLIVVKEVNCAHWCWCLALAAVRYRERWLPLVDCLLTASHSRERRLGNMDRNDDTRSLVETCRPYTSRL